MKQQISALMDGEMFEDEAEVLLDQLKRHPQADQDWEIYHLIGDALRQPDCINCCSFSASFHQRLQAEPTLLAPRRQPYDRIKHYAVSVAASVMVLALVAWLATGISSEQAVRMADASLPQVVRPAAYQVDDYVMAHQEVSPSTDVQGVATFIHTVAVRQ